jgi:hypothetical protein
MEKLKYQKINETKTWYTRLTNLYPN